MFARSTTLICGLMFFACDVPCPDVGDGRASIETTSINENGEIVSAAEALEEDWKFQLEEDGSILEVDLPDGVGPPPPRGEGCCTVRLPEKVSSVRQEAQVFVDDALYFELSTPRPAGTTEGMHAEIADSEPTQCRSGGVASLRYEILFSFASGVFGKGEVARGTVDDISVEGLVLDDAASTDANPQVIVYRSL